MFLRLAPFILIICTHYSVKAQSGTAYQKIENNTDSLAEIEAFPRSEKMYLKALKFCDQNPLLHINLPSLYLEIQKTNEAKKFMESALTKGADLDMLLLDARIKSYLNTNRETHERYNLINKQAKAFIQLEDKSKWIDDFRRSF